jgi:HEAT repeat protein
MSSFDFILAGGAAAAVTSWAALSLYTLAIQRRRGRAQATVAGAMATLGLPEVAGLPLAERVECIRPVLRDASRELIMYAVANRATPRAAADVFAAYLVERWSLEALERDAASHRSGRDKWRRMSALQILFHLGHSRQMELLAAAIADRDADVAGVALSLLGESDHPEAVDILVHALRARRQPASRIALYLDQSPQHLASCLRPLLADADPVVRRWAATLLGRYGDVGGLERDLARVADDTDPRVRKAAVQSLGQIGVTVAAVTALRLLHDPVAFVRAAAVRAIGRLDREDLAEHVTVLLGDRDWWVRFAAKECLESMGAGIWPILVRLLDHRDRFVRNGAAEVFQNLGVLDSFIVLEAASDNPASQKIDLLRRVAAAGGLRLTDSLIERAGPSLAPRLRHLLQTIGLEHVGAA